MPKKKSQDKALNLETILFNCRDDLRAARNSGSFFEKRDMMLTLVFLRFIGEKYDDGVEKDLSVYELNNVLVGHLAFGHQKRVMMDYFRNNRRKFERT